jgi:ferredoxin
MAETGERGDLSRRGFLAAAGIAALGLAGLRVLTESGKRPRRAPSVPEGPPPRIEASPAPPQPQPDRGRMRVRVTEACFACALCCQTCPEVFALGSQFAEVIVPEVPEQSQEKCRQAARDCPAEAIVIEEGR